MDEARGGSETDARPGLSGGVRKLLPTPTSTPPTTTTTKVRARRDDERYFMRHERRGAAVIFNHEHFDAMRPRAGTAKDAVALRDSLRGLGFDVRLHHDLKYDAIRDVLSKVALEDHSQSDCLLVAVMSHGEQGGLLYARDHCYSAAQLWGGFTGRNCPSLLGKPKLFFIQACRGEGLDPGSRVVCDSVDALGSSSSYSIPHEADVLVMYSTVEGYYSWRNPSEGSWFIQALSKELAARGATSDLLSLLTAVSRRVALLHQSCVPGDALMDRKLQMPSLLSTLTRDLYFH